MPTDFLIGALFGAAGIAVVWHFAGLYFRHIHGVRRDGLE